MNWRDVTIAVAQWVFVFGLIPMVRDTQKPTLYAAVPTTAALTANTVALCASGLWLGGLTCGIAAILWGVLAVQRYQKDWVGRPFQKSWIDTLLQRD